MRLITILFRILLLYFSISNFLIAQSVIKDYPFPTPSIDESHHQVKVYYPTGYRPGDKTKYNVVIYLHGSSGNSFIQIANVIKPAADALIGSFIKPVIIIMPNIQTQITPGFGNRHLYENSEYYGKYGDVILKDLYAFIRNTTDNNLSNKVDTTRGHVAIAGFSMGGDGALRLGLKNPEKYTAIAAHGAAPSFALSLINNIIALILNENRNSINSSGNYIYNPDAVYTGAVMGISAAWNPNSSSGQLQFLLNPNGSLNDAAYSAMFPNADCQTIIKSKGLYKTATNNPFLYLEVGTSDGFFDINNQFISELNSLGVDPKWYTYITSPGKPHGFDIDRAAEALKWIDEKLMPVSTTFVSNFQLNTDYTLRSNYQSKKIEITLNTIPGAGYIYLHDLNGRLINKLRTINAQSEYYFDMFSVPDGVFVVHISSGNKIGSAKLVWKK